jgi:hypothetical protein
MNQPLFRDGKGRIVGGINEWFTNEDDHYVDYKERDVRYPEHKGNLNGEVTVWNLNDK